MNYEELSLEQKQFWENIAKKTTLTQNILINLCKTNKCIWCKKKFDGGIIKKHPGKFIPINAYVLFTAKYLVHCQTTHGLSPEILTDILNKIS